MVTNSGGGYSRWNDFDVTRWRCDPALDRWGSYIYIRDVNSQRHLVGVASAGRGRYGFELVRFSADRAEFQRRASGIETVLAVTVRRRTTSNCAA